MDKNMIEKMKTLLKEAAGKAIVSLFHDHNENFYYCSLITDGEGHCPIVSAWSWEALERMAQKEDDPEEAEYFYKWSYADSPYFAYGEEYFSEVSKLFLENIERMEDMDEDTYEQEFDLLLHIMECVMAELDEEGLFGSGEQRKKIVVNAEVMPPDYTNTERALRLNPPEALTDWLEECAEEE